MDADLKARFDAALDRSKSLPKQPPATQLDLYGLFKQATVGAVSGKRPGPFDVRGRAKWDAWSARKGLSTADAMTTYIEAIEKLAAG